MTTVEPPHRVGPVINHQAWCVFSGLHWSYDPAVVGALIPDGLQLQTFEDAAWVSITPFLMEEVRLPFLPPVPGLSTFPETNLRTYVTDKEGRDGIWFFALEAASRPLVAAARTAYGLPYNWADMKVEQRGSVVRYESRRRWGGPPAHTDIKVEIGDVLPPDRMTDLEVFLTHRWRGFAPLPIGLGFTPVEHEPWPLRNASVRYLDETLVVAAGLPPPSANPIVHYSPGVHVRLGAPRLSGAGLLRFGRRGDE